MRWSEVAPQNSATSLMLVTWSACMLPSMYRVIVLATEDIQAIHDELLAKGIDFELPPGGAEQTARVCGIRKGLQDPATSPRGLLISRF
jgi:hypothetical protein